MQTFLPFENFDMSAEVLDRQRLGKQRVEAKQIIQTIQKGSEAKGWANHPAVKMWEDYIPTLAFYGTVICHAWRDRGYKDTLLPFFEKWMDSGPMELPWWLGNEEFHTSHKSNLLRKKEEYYIQFFQVDPMLPYLWPNKEKDHWTTGVKPS